MKESLRGLEGDLHSFTQLHQAGSTSMGSGAEKSALRRTLQKLAGELFGDG
jgi:hypothetical protein